MLRRQGEEAKIQAAILIQFPTLYTDAAKGERLTGYATVLVRGQKLRVVQKESIGALNFFSTLSQIKSSFISFESAD